MSVELYTLMSIGCPRIVHGDRGSRMLELPICSPYKGRMGKMRITLSSMGGMASNQVLWKLCHDYGDTH